MTNANEHRFTGISHWALGFGHFLFLSAIIVVTAGALAVRLPGLGTRVMHCDEANQAVRAGILLETGVYHYSPEEHHGPTLYWLTLPSLWLAGVHDFAHSDEFAYRIVPVVFGVGLVLLLLLLSDGLGRGATIVAGVLTAVSPAMVFYSRYYVQETLLVFFTLATLACGWRYVRSRSVGWAVAAGVAMGLMHATKETWIVAGASMGVALCLTAAKGVTWRVVRDAIIAAVAAVIVAVVFYSSFGTHARGPLDSLLAYSTYFRRGTEPSIHTHPWYFYLELLTAYRPARGFFWTEGLIVGLAAVGAATSVGRWFRTRSQVSLSPCSSPVEQERGETGFCVFLTIYTVLVTTLYALIPYKTPWCLLTFLHAMILLAGVGAMAVLRWMPGRVLKIVMGGLLIAGIAYLGRECYWLNFRLAADTRNPWVYAHTSSDTLNFAAQMERLANASEEGHGMAIHVVTPENYWPLPWYLRRFVADRIGYWPDAADWARDVAQLAPPAVIVLSPDVQTQVDARLRAEYNKQITFGLRPGVLMLVYVRSDLWERFAASK
jgi:uncharacterized protein (TIGR03663 family)